MFSEIYMNGGTSHLACRCCGEVAKNTSAQAPHRNRCEKHQDRNPCAIEGCSRTTAAKRDLDGGDQWVCSVHWKIVAPPRGRERRLYHAWHRKGRRAGWPAEMAAAYFRFWDRLIARGRARCAGDIDMNEINRMFGWD